MAGLSIGAYGEVKFGTMQNPAAGGQWQNGFDTARMVLLPTYAITDNIIFNAEIEFEHAGAGFDNDDKLHGTAEIEQIWIDFKIIDQFNWRAPGIDLVPIGYINQHHEPTQFYSVNRPELYNGLIPSTWKVPGTSVYGTITEGLKYQVMVSTSNEDYGNSFDNRTAANTVPLPGTPYFPGIDGLNALTFSNPPLGGFLQLNDAVADLRTVRLHATVVLRASAASIHGYYTPNISRAERMMISAISSETSMAIYDAEFRDRIPETWARTARRVVRATFGNPANLRANNDSNPTDNVGKSMYRLSPANSPTRADRHHHKQRLGGGTVHRYTYQNFNRANSTAPTSTCRPASANAIPHRRRRRSSRHQN